MKLLIDKLTIYVLRKTLLNLILSLLLLPITFYFLLIYYTNFTLLDMFEILQLKTYYIQMLKNLKATIYVLLATFITITLLQMFLYYKKTHTTPVFFIKAYLLPYYFNFYNNIKKEEEKIFDKLTKITDTYILYCNKTKINYNDYYKNLEDIKQYLNITEARVERYKDKCVKVYYKDNLQSFKFTPTMFKKDKVYFGKGAKNNDIYVNLTELTHYLIVGQSGSGKSVLQNLLINNFIYNLNALEALILVDLKGGVEFLQYRKVNKKIKVITSIQQLHALLQKLIIVMEKRYKYMSQRDAKNWKGKQIVVFIDEYASINDMSQVLEKKEHKELQNNIRTLLAKARASGIKFFVATQKATSDSIDTTVRENLQTKILMRTISKDAQRAVLGSNEIIEELGANPANFSKGRFIYFSDTIQDIVQAPYIEEDFYKYFLKEKK